MDDRTRVYTPAQFYAEMKAVITKAHDNGVSMENTAQATMGLAHALWDECYGDAEGATLGLLNQIKAKHPSWAEIGSELEDLGYGPVTN